MLGLLQVYLNKMASRRKGVAFVMYAVHAGLLNVNVQFRWNLICSEHTLMVLLIVEYEEDYSTV